LCHHVLPGRDTAEGFVGSLFVVAGDPIDRHATDRTEGFKGGSRFKCRKCVIQLLQDQNIDPDDSVWPDGLWPCAILCGSALRSMRISLAWRHTLRTMNYVGYCYGNHPFTFAPSSIY
jgi:hypothetical protein